MDRRRNEALERQDKRLANPIFVIIVFQFVWYGMDVLFGIRIYMIWYMVHGWSLDNFSTREKKLGRLLSRWINDVNRDDIYDFYDIKLRTLIDANNIWPKLLSCCSLCIITAFI